MEEVLLQSHKVFDTIEKILNDDSKKKISGMIEIYKLKRIV